MIKNHSSKLAAAIVNTLRLLLTALPRECGRLSNRREKEGFSPLYCSGFFFLTSSRHRGKMWNANVHQMNVFFVICDHFKAEGYLTFRKDGLLCSVLKHIYSFEVLFSFISYLFISACNFPIFLNEYLALRWIFSNSFHKWSNFIHYTFQLYEVMPAHYASVTLI